MKKRVWIVLSAVLLLIAGASALIYAKRRNSEPAYLDDDKAMDRVIELYYQKTDAD